MVKGGVETLSFFSAEIEKYFLSNNIKTFWLDLDDLEKSAKHLKKFIKEDETALLTFNFLALSGEKYIYDEDRGYIWEIYNIPVYNIVVDHPLYYVERYPLVPPKYTEFHIDLDHERYYENYYPELKSGGFLPLAGTCYNDYVIPAFDEWIESKDIDILFVGSYMDPKEYMKYITRINDEYTSFYMGMVDDLFDNPMQSLTDVARRHCIREMGDKSIETWKVIYKSLNFLDLYIRAVARENAVKAIAKAGVNIDIFGHKWENASIKANNVKLHGPTDSKTCLMMMQRAKISLNVLPWFREGAHDRVFNAMANGSLCLTDESLYLDKIFNDKEDYILYDISDVSDLGDKADKLLKDNEYIYKLVNKAYKKTLKGHLWSDRAKVLYDYMMNDK